MYYKFNSESLVYEKASLVKPTMAIAGLILAITSLFGFTYSSNEKYLTQEEKVIILDDYNKFTDEKLINSIKELNFKFPYIVYAQAKHESENFSSPIFNENRNLFGMKEAKSRLNLAIGTNRGHALYTSWQKSVTDYALYCASYLGALNTEAKYFDYLGKYYAEDPNYVAKLKTMIEKNKLKEVFK